MSLGPLNRRVRAVARREYVQRVRNKWFLITTFLVPLLFAGAIALTVYLGEGGGNGGGPLLVGVVDRTETGMAERLAALGTIGADADLPAPGESLRPGASPMAALEAARRAPLGFFPETLPDSLRTAEQVAAYLPTSGYDAFLLVTPEAVGEVVPRTGPSGDAAAAGGPGAAGGVRRDAERGPGREEDEDGEEDEGLELQLVARQGVSQSQRTAVRDAARRALTGALLARAGADSALSEAVLRSAQLRVRVVRAEAGAARSQEALQGLGLALGAVLYFMLLVYGQMIVRGVIEEKSSDIVEVLLSSLRPWEMMLGKVLGVGAVGLTQVAIWALTLVAVALYGVAMASPFLAEAGVQLGAFDVSVLPVLGSFVLYFLLGYLLYASAFAAAGAMSGSEQDAQQVSMPLNVLIVAAFLLLMPMMDTPDATWAVVVSQVPFFSPVLMVARVAGGMASALEVVASLLLLVAGTFATVWLAGRIYRVGILMKGKRPTLPELVRWLRYG